MNMGASCVYGKSFSESPVSGGVDTYSLGNGAYYNFIEIILIVLLPEIFNQLVEVDGERSQRIRAVGECGL